MDMGEINMPLMSTGARRKKAAQDEAIPEKPPKVTYVGEVPLYEGDDYAHASWRRQMERELWGTP